VGPVWIERAGRLECTDVRFASAGDLREAIERILAPLGRRVDEAEPLCDARLPDRRRVTCKSESPLARPSAGARWQPIAWR
jgi:pilus assembly protein CpaF